MTPHLKKVNGNGNESGSGSVGVTIVPVQPHHKRHLRLQALQVLLPLSPAGKAAVLQGKREKRFQLSRLVYWVSRPNSVLCWESYCTC